MELGWQGFFLQLSTGSTDNIKPELVLQDFYQYFGKTYDPFNIQIHRVETYERTEEGLRPLYQAGDNLESYSHYHRYVHLWQSDTHVRHGIGTTLSGSPLSKGRAGIHSW